MMNSTFEFTQIPTVLFSYLLIVLPDEEGSIVSIAVDLLALAVVIVSGFGESLA